MPLNFLGVLCCDNVAAPILLFFLVIHIQKLYLTFLFLKHYKSEMECIINLKWLRLVTSRYNHDTKNPFHPQVFTYSYSVVVELVTVLEVSELEKLAISLFHLQQNLQEITISSDYTTSKNEALFYFAHSMNHD